MPHNAHSEHRNLALLIIPLNIYLSTRKYVPIKLPSSEKRFHKMTILDDALLRAII